MEHITASCVIRENMVYQNGQLVWEGSSGGSREGLSGGSREGSSGGSREGLSGGSSGHLPDFLLSAYQHFGFQYPKFYKMDHLSKLAWLSAELLLGERRTAAEYAPEDVAVVLSNAHSSLDTDYRYFATVGEIPSPALFVYTLPNIMTGEICIRHRLKGENAFFISDAFNAEFIAAYVNDLLSTGMARASICGWVDVLGDEYSAALFLVEHKITTLPFTAKAMNNLFNVQRDRYE